VDLVAIGLMVWAHFLAKRPDAPRWLRSVKWSVGVIWAACLIGTWVGLKRAFASVPGATPAQRQEQLSTDIAHAMTFTAVALIVDVVVLVLLAALTSRLRTRGDHGQGLPGRPTVRS
jgi:hypothetical protein